METGLSIHDLNALLSKATEEIQADQKIRDAADKRITINVKWRQAIQARISATQTDGDTSSYGRKWDNVRNAIKAISKARFTQLDVEAELKKLDPQSQIDRARLRNTLWSLQQKSELIKQIRKGNNQQPALFERLPEATSVASVPPPRPSLPQRRTVLSE